ncbi:(2Fe-2S)-binding protein [Pelagibacterales bacterium SAG-MED05]|nr:(2Fe-2S)-binding protein [Pelagibacterales bacterium SAG-MED05]
MSALDNKKSSYIKKNKKVSFTFDGKKYYGYKGDTIASALLRNNVRLIARSFKYHRPRGIYTCGIEEPNAIVQILNEHNEPNARATVKQIYEGMKVDSQNRWPSLNLDIGSINNLLSPMFSAGFYYKTFMGPKGFWKKIYEPIIRRTAGLGKPPKEFRSKSIHQNHNVDIVIVGAGLSGLIAARKLIDTEYDVLLLEQDSFLGGVLKNSNKVEQINNQEVNKWIKETERLIKISTNIKILKNSLVTSYNFTNHLIALEDKFAGKAIDTSKSELTLHKIRTTHTILANGHIERFISFRNNDLPGVMLASSFEKYIHRYGVIPETNPVIFTNNSTTVTLLKSLVDLGHKPVAYVDARDKNKIGKKLLTYLKKNNIPFYFNAEIEGCDGNKKVETISIRKNKNKIIKVKSSMLCVSGGINPDIHLFTQSKGLVKWDDKLITFKPDVPFQNTITIGSVSGNYNYEKTHDEINNKLSFLKPKNIEMKIKINDTNNFNIKELWETRHEKKSNWSKSFIDLHNDVTTKDLKQAVVEGFDRIEHLKRFTTNSMGTDQGKISSINSLGIVSKILKKEISEVGTTTYRPPYAPLSFSAIAGRNTYEFYDPQRKTPIHNWHINNKAIFEDVGQWKRPWYFKEHDSETMHQAVQRESKQTRQTAGILDGSTLGKIEIKGKDALEFMNLMYTNPFTKMKPMTSRYALMLGEDGMIKDDGIVCKFNDKHFIATTTSGGAPKVLADMEEYLQTEWPHLQVYVNSITEQFTTFNISGPKSRDIMSKVFTEVDFSNENFPFMTFKVFNYKGTEARIMRASFTGELGYEIYITPNHGLELWKRIFHHGNVFDLVPYGTETMHLLRAEKGYVVIGQETDGTVTPIDLNFNWMIGKKKKDFIGKRSLTRSDTAREDRKQLVGIVPLDKSEFIEEGQHVVERERLPNPIKTPVEYLGHVSSSYHSPNLNHCIAMAMIKGGNKLMGKKLFISSSYGTKNIAVEVVSPVFIDPENKRLTS